MPDLKPYRENCTECKHHDIFWGESGCNLLNNRERCKFEPQKPLPERKTGMRPMKLVSISHAQSRLNFFRDQLATANRRLDWSMKHNPDWYDHSEKGEVVSFYEWAVKMAEKEVDSNEP